MSHTYSAAATVYVWHVCAAACGITGVYNSHCCCLPVWSDSFIIHGCV